MNMSLEASIGNNDNGSGGSMTAELMGNFTNALAGAEAGSHELASSLASPTDPIMTKINLSSGPESKNPLHGTPTGAAYKITQVGAIGGSNVVVSRLDVPRPSSTAAPPPAVPALTTSFHARPPPPAFYYPPQPQPPGQPQSQAQTHAQAQQQLSGSFSAAPYTPSPAQYYHKMTMNSTMTVPVTKFTNMVPNASAAPNAKNPLKPNHSIASNFYSTTGASISANSASTLLGLSGKTPLKASDLIHILPNLVQTLKRRHSSITTNSGTTSQAQMSGRSGGLTAEQLLCAVSRSTMKLAENASSSAVPEESETGSDPANKRPRSSSSSNIVHAGSQMHHCEVCGKVYKHRNCLSKHLWEHHDSWEHTRRVCQTKHQQVQLLEAAQVLAEIQLGLIGKERRLFMMQMHKQSLANAKGGEQQDPGSTGEWDGSIGTEDEEGDAEDMDEEDALPMSISTEDDAVMQDPGTGSSEAAYKVPMPVL